MSGWRDQLQNPNPLKPQTKTLAIDIEGVFWLIRGLNIRKINGDQRLTPRTSKLAFAILAPC